ncbi:bifunctional phosphopantothenoylcysteine decarboxylase/phosphopantothenate--cysteine ligase CoaBC [Archaeoglobus veneficus]|uniref:Coenzyme A biosynthesis bifunctional protein CoaBC n=1 Tax=Archaeoglobus veneficus (strain DSM 11195 / SNP6) TaxID=693661 RepID=F2KT58_ARCVS|nr:bifunctional phosphopantothenoylcysteine decarboxylase/phosphopantothenate--cysteine ligase CoaBC [Archaeoglobus veneficus]AEA47088.1 phosphopantothenoylcysteine decarboxylase/phosphopantothenate/cysteine ligase [Archaeoglobus veneficus SNP6]
MPGRLEGKTVVLGITGSLAAVECVKLARELQRRGAKLFVVMSESAESIIGKAAMEFVAEVVGEGYHVKLLGNQGIADAMLIAPATANTISKIANGIADSAITTMALTALGSGKPVILAPAMHGSMMESPFFAESLEKVKKHCIVVEPKYAEGKAKLADIETICLHVERALSSKEFEGKKVVVTSGPTYEFLDPIRFISNRSSGRMGRELALEFWRRGASIVHITSKPTGLNLPNFREVAVISVSDMLEACLSEINDCNLFVSAAAPADFTVEKEESKIKTAEELVVRLKAAPKILWEVRKVYDGPVIGFKAETGISEDELYEIAYEKMLHDRLDMVVANDVIHRGMGTPDTKVLIVTAKRKIWAEGLKSEIARRIVDIYVEDCLCSSPPQA